MYLEHSGSLEAAYRLERLFGGKRRPKADATFAELPTAVVKSNDKVAIRMKIPGYSLRDVRVDDGVVYIKLQESPAETASPSHPSATRQVGTALRAVHLCTEET